MLKKIISFILLIFFLPTLIIIAQDDIIGTASIITADGARVRSADGELLDTIAQGTELNLLAVHDDMSISIGGTSYTGWLEVQLESGETGFIWNQSNLVNVEIAEVNEVTEDEDTEVSGSIFADIEVGVYEFEDFENQLGRQLFYISPETNQPVSLYYSVKESGGDRTEVFAQVIVANEENIDLVFDAQTESHMAHLTFESEGPILDKFGSINFIKLLATRHQTKVRSE